MTLEKLFNKAKESTDRLGLNGFLSFRYVFDVYKDNAQLGKITYNNNGIVKFVVNEPNRINRLGLITLVDCIITDGYEIGFAESYSNSAILCDLDNDNMLEEFIGKLTESVAKYRLCLLEVEKRKINDEKNGVVNKYEIMKKQWDSFLNK